MILSFYRLLIKKYVQICLHIFFLTIHSINSFIRIIDDCQLLSAPDFAFHKIKDTDTNFTLDVSYIDQRLNNQNLLFVHMLAVLGDIGHCLVSPKCSIPNQFHSHVILLLRDSP